MTTISKHFFDYISTITYFIERIRCKKKLSEKIIEKINFKEGEFFTFLPNYAFLEKLYHFKGGILPSFQISNNAWQVSSKGWKIEDFVFEFLRENAENFVIADQYIAECADLNREGVDITFYQDEAHYIVRNNAPLESIRDAIEDTNHGWHMLTILTSGLELPKKTLDDQDFDIICKNLKYIITTCYDGEGYLFWERKS